MSFLSTAFLGALVAAAGPPVIHLLNRRRFRTVQWAAMSFLQNAMRQKRRSMEIQDLLLMLLRTLVVILFVLAMARPFWVSGQATTNSGQPVHAIVVVDNSLSMAYREFDKTLLDQAKKKAAAFIDRLPDGSAISIVPMALTSDFQLRDTFRSKDAAKEGLQSIEVVDRGALAGQAIRAAEAAAKRVPQMPNKRIVLLSDRQRSTWGGTNLKRAFEDIERAQLVDVGGGKRTNSWVGSVRVRDGFAGGDTPAVILATVRHEGDQPRDDVPVSLEVNGSVVAQRTVDLTPGQQVELMFKHQFDAAGNRGEPLMRAVTVRLGPDRLPVDDHRSIMVPVVESAPVVCIDRYGRDENPKLNLYGETYPIRRLLAPRATGSESGDFSDDQGSPRWPRATAPGSAIAIRHVKQEALNRRMLTDARLVVVAGISQPSDQLVDLLRQYTEQGGMLLIGAGGDFDPAAWTANAWRDGQGILPLPLQPQPLGSVASNNNGYQPTAGAGDDGAANGGGGGGGAFRLDPDSLTDAAFDLDLPDRVVSRLLTSPFFFKAVKPKESSVDKMLEQMRQRLASQRQANDEVAKSQSTADSTESADTADDAAAQSVRVDVDRIAPTKPTMNGANSTSDHWLGWSNPGAPDLSALNVDQRIDRTRPRVMGRYSTGDPFAIRRSIGQGTVIMITTGFFPRWNSLAANHAVILLDRLARHMLSNTMPRRDLDAVGQVVIPVASSEVGRTFTAHVPGESAPVTLSPEALGKNSYALFLRDVRTRGVYRVEGPSSGGGGSEQSPAHGVEPIVFAVHGPSSESDLTNAENQTIVNRAGQTKLAIVQGDEPISLAGQSYVSRSLWKWLLILTLVLLVAEMTVLSAPHRHRVKTPNPLAEPAPA